MSRVDEAPGRAPAWFLLLVAGEAATLSLVDAGTRVHYQHLIPPALWRAGSHRAAVALLAVELAAVAWGLWRSRPALAVLGREVGGVRLALTLGGVALFASTLSPSPLVFARELTLAASLQLLHLATLFLGARSVRAGTLAWFGAGVDRVLAGSARRLKSGGGRDGLVALLAVAVVAISAALAVGSYQRHPHVPDEVAYLLQARTYAAGLGSLPAPPVPAAFETYLMWAHDGRWFSVFPPAWPALLALGFLAGAPWLVNPLLAGLNVVLANATLRELYPVRTARLATLLFALSPWSLFLAMSWMSHTSSLTCALLAAWMVARLRRDPRLRWAALGGAAAGLLSLFRPLELAVVAPLLGLATLGARGRRHRFLPAAVFSLVALGAIATNLPYNRHFTGAAGTFPVMAYMDETFGAGSNALGFGANRGATWGSGDPLPGHGPVDAAINADLNLFQINLELFGWPVGSLLAVALLLALGRLRGADRWMVGAIGVVVGLHSLYWFSGGSDFGARYWFLALLPLVALSARGIEVAAARAGGAAAGGERRVEAAAAALIAIALALFVPWRAADKYFHYRGMRPDIREMAADPAWRGAVVLVRGQRHPDYASAVVYNPIVPADPGPVFVWDRDRATREAIARAFAAKSFWIVDGPTVTGAGYRVVAGPLTRDEVLRLPDPPPAAHG